MNPAIKNAKDPETVDWLIATFAQDVQLDIDDALRSDLTLRDIVDRSEHLHNSLDLMESFARLAHLLKKRTGVKVRLPNFPADEKLSNVLAAFIQAFESASEATRDGAAERGAAQ